MKLIEIRKDGRSAYVEQDKVISYLMRGWELPQRNYYATKSN